MKRTLLSAFLVAAFLLPAWPQLFSKKTVVHAEATGNSRKASSDLKHKVNSGRGNDLVRVIIQPVNAWNTTLESTVQNSGGHNERQFQNFRLRAVTISAKAALELANRQDIAYVSLNREVRTLGHVSVTTGADAVRTWNCSTIDGVDGTGIGIAVLDSGIDADHTSFNNGSNPRVIASQDFTGEGRTDDPYGHGTHVASIAAGNGRVSYGEYLGIAPNANIINLRVLNSEGVGSTSGLLAALDWVASNRNVYNIRVVNMSLGLPAVDSYLNDPVCLAVRSLANSGVVMVAASGNNGTDGNGNKVYGHIHSPGIEPSAITVGAANTFGTDERNDDTVTSYSSRGPTRGYWTDDAGVKHYDNLIKPDLVAPGNKIVAAEARQNLLVTEHPQLDAGVSSFDNRKMMYLNGSSMATPVAAGAAALMLQVNPTLTPNLLKVLLM